LINELIQKLTSSTLYLEYYGHHKAGTSIFRGSTSPRISLTASRTTSDFLSMFPGTHPCYLMVPTLGCQVYRSTICILQHSEAFRAFGIAPPPLQYFFSESRLYFFVHLTQIPRSQWILFCFHMLGFLLLLFSTRNV
jgi:hypothetical protein